MGTFKYPFKKNKPNRLYSCAWLAKKGTNYIKKKCKSDDVLDGCSSTCGLCDGDDDYDYYDDYQRESNCCTNHNKKGCDDQQCKKKVCNKDKFCCKFGWDTTCVRNAKKWCNGLCS